MKKYIKPVLKFIIILILIPILIRMIVEPFYFRSLVGCATWPTGVMDDYGKYNSDVKFKLVPKIIGFDAVIYGEGYMDMNMTIDSQNSWKSEVLSYVVDWIVDVRTVKVREGVQSLCGYSFFCKNLTKVILPSTLEVIGDNAFADCPNLLEIEYGGTMKEWGILESNSPGWYYNCPIEKIICSDGVVTIDL